MRSAAVLYSGRFYSNATHIASWVASHMDLLIRPNNATVFVVADADSWCDASAEAQAAIAAGTPDGFALASLHFEHEVRNVFGNWPKLHARLLPKVSASLAHRADTLVPGREFDRAARAMRASVYNVKLNRNLVPHMQRWYYQYEHVAQAEALRRRVLNQSRVLAEGADTPDEVGHEIVVRARLDTILSAQLNLSDPRYLNDSVLHAPGYRAVRARAFTRRSLPRS